MSERAGLELSGASIHGPRGPVLEGLEWHIPARGVTVVLGPAGTGKSALLRALSGQPAPPGWTYGGRWSYAGRPLELAAAAGELAWCRQVRPHRAAPPSGALASALEEPCPWRAALTSGARVVLLDEPDRQRDSSGLVEAIRARARDGAVVLVTHNLRLARAVADEACLLVDGRMHARGAAGSFFDRPPSDLAQRFMAQGNCWPAKAGPALPTHFRWLESGRLAGMGRPGLLGDAEHELEAIASASVALLVSLTEQPYPLERLRPFGIASRHFPIRDMGIPAVGATQRLCAEIDRVTKRGDAVAVHCHAGLGRTGTILAAVLVWRGLAPEAAIARVRTVCERYIQTDAQLRFVHRFAERG